MFFTKAAPESGHMPANGPSAPMLKRAQSLDFAAIFRSSQKLEVNATSQCSRSVSKGDLELLDRKEDQDEGVWSAQDKTDQQWAVDRGERTARLELRLPAGRMTMIGISVGLLLLATLVDFGVSHIHKLESPSDGLSSSQVTRPPFDNKAAKSSHPARLGSAAIASITDVLSPILPFTGGLDLRRDDYWGTSGSWVERIQAVSGQVKAAFVGADDVPEIPRGGSSPVKIKKRPRSKHDKAISAPKPFLATSKIAELTLGDVTEGFRYAVESSKAGFSEPKFRYRKSPRVIQMIDAIQTAVAASRGKDLADTFVDREDEDAGNIDSLKFSAALRIFAEWRVLRQVPEGYKGYAVGMGLGQKDVVQNLVKIEQGVHDYIDHRRDLIALQEQLDGRPSSEPIRTPTIRQLMQHEVDMGTHVRLPRLKEKSAAMGLLWVRRQIQYQTNVFRNVLTIPGNKFKDTEDAVASAYKEVYDRFHGWAVKKIFNYSFSAAPDASAIYRHMNPHRLKEVTKEAKNISNLPTKNAPATASVCEGWTCGWDKFTSSVGRIFGDDTETEVSVRGGAEDDASLPSPRDEFISREMMKDAHLHIKTYLDVALPLLLDLDKAFVEFNMNDLTRV